MQGFLLCENSNITLRIPGSVYWTVSAQWWHSDTALCRAVYRSVVCHCRLDLPSQTPPFHSFRNSVHHGSVFNLKSFSNFQQRATFRSRAQHLYIQSHYKNRQKNTNDDLKLVLVTFQRQFPIIFGLMTVKDKKRNSI